MAQVVEKMPKIKNSPNRHPFSKYMDGQIWKLTKGEDFTCEVESMRRQLNRFATAQGLILECHQSTSTGEVWVKRT